MADDGSKNKVSEHKKPPETVEKVPAEKKHPLEQFKTGMVEHGLGRRKKKAESEVKIEALKKFIKESDIALLNQIDVGSLDDLIKPENVDKTRALFLCSKILMQILFAKGLMNPIAVKDISVFKDTDFESQLSGNSLTVYKKIKEIAEKAYDSNAKFAIFFKKSWNQIVDSAKGTYEEAKEYISGEKEESSLKKVGTLLTIGAVAGVGIFGAYYVLRGIKRAVFESDEEKKDRKRKEAKEKKGGFIGKTLKWALGGAASIGGAALIGKILHEDGMSGFLKEKFDIDISWKNMKKVGKALANFEFGKAWDQLTKSINVPEKLIPIYEKAAEATGIDYDSLVFLGSEDYDKFTSFSWKDNMSFWSFMNEVSAKGWEEAMKNVPKEADWIPSRFIGGLNTKQMRKLAVARKKLMEYFRKESVKVKIKEAEKLGKKPKKVRDAFVILFGEGDVEYEHEMESLPAETELAKVDGVIGVDDRADKIINIAKGTKLESEVKKISEIFSRKDVGLISGKSVKRLIGYSERLAAKEKDEQKKRDLLILSTALRSSLSERKSAYDDYEKEVERVSEKGDDMTEEDIDGVLKKALKVENVNHTVKEEYGNLQDQITIRYASESYHLYFAVIPARLLRWWKRPRAAREYYKYLIYSKGRERVREMFRKREIKKITLKTKFSVAKETHLNRLKGDVRAKIGDVELKKVMTKSSVALDRVNMAKVADKDMVRFIELHYEKQLLKSRRTIVWHEDKIKSMAANDPDLPKMKAKLRKLKMKDLEIHSAHVQADMATHRLNIEGKVGEMAKEMSPDKILKRADFAELEKTVLRGRTFSKKLEKATSAKLKEISDAVKRGASNAEVKALDKEFRRLSEMKAKFEFNELRKVKDVADKWWKSWKDIKKKLKVSVAGSGVMGAGKNTEKMFDLAYSSQKNQLRRIIKNTAWGQAKVWMKQGVSKGFKRPLRSVGKKVMFYTLVPAALGMVGKDETRGIDWWTESKQVGMDMLPFLGTYSDAYAAYTGEEYVTGRKIDETGQIIRGVMAGVGGVCDILTFAAGAGLIGRVAVGGLKAVKGGRSAYKAYRLAMKGAKEAQSVSALMKARKVGQMSMMGLGLGTLAYYTLKPTHAVDVSPAMEEILGDDLMDMSQAEYDEELKTVMASNKNVVH